MNINQARKLTEQAFNELTEAVAAGKSEKLIAYLKAMGRLHRYSLGNILLVSLQKPDASHVAGFRGWQKLGRHVKKGLSKTGGNYNADANSDGKVSVKELGNPSTSEEGAGVQDFPEFVKSLPELETPFPNVHGWLLQGRNQQVAFVHFTEETDVPEHSHRAQWEIIIAGEVRLKLNGRENVYRAGQSFFIPEGRPHGAVVSKDFRSVILFDQPDRFQAK